jgi:hypothetical protein
VGWDSGKYGGGKSGFLQAAIAGSPQSLPTYLKAGQRQAGQDFDLAK